MDFSFWGKLTWKSHHTFRFPRWSTKIQVQPAATFGKTICLRLQNNLLTKSQLQIFNQGRIFSNKKSHGIRLKPGKFSTKNHPLFLPAFCYPFRSCLKYFYKKYVDGHKSLRKIGPPATSLLNSQVLFSQGLDLIFTQLRPEKRGPRFLRWLPPATSLGGSSTRGKFTCLQRHPVTLIGGKSKCFAFWVNLDRWKSPFSFCLLVAHWFSQWTNGPIIPDDGLDTCRINLVLLLTTDSWTAPENGSCDEGWIDLWRTKQHPLSDIGKVY